MIEFDFSEVVALQADLQGVPKQTAPFVRKAVQVTAQHVKDDARSFANFYFGGGSAAGYPIAMEYDLFDEAGGVRAEVGPRPGGQGDLAPLFDGSGNPFSGRKPSLEPALADNVDDFVRGLSKAIDDGLGSLA